MQERKEHGKRKVTFDKKKNRREIKEKTKEAGMEANDEDED